jgi:hypothetical protein
VTAEIGELLLLENVEPRSGMVSALRIRADGTFESKGANREDWEELYRFTPQELEEVRTALAEADDPPLSLRYEARPGAAVTQRWVLETPRGEVRVQISGGAKVPALEHLFQRLQLVHDFGTD